VLPLLGFTYVVSLGTAVAQRYMTRIKVLDHYLRRIAGAIFLVAGLHDTLTYWALYADQGRRWHAAAAESGKWASVMCSRGGRAMRRASAYYLAMIMATLGWLLFGTAATASEHLFQAMGMATLPGKPAPDFTLPDLDGQRVSLQQYRGKVVFLNFWATWCIPCREEMPAMEQLFQTFQPQGLVILAVDLKESPDRVKAFFHQYRLSYTALLDESGSVSRDYQVMGLPTTYLIGRKGTLLARGVGGRDWTRTEGKDLIRALLAGAPEASKRDPGIVGGD
jgi:peroxiredoxin